jgi:hypothetical protein
MLAAQFLKYSRLHLILTLQRKNLYVARDHNFVTPKTKIKIVLLAIYDRPIYR